MEKAIKKGLIRLNGEVVEGGRYVKEGDEISLLEPNAKVFKAYHLKLEVVYEDEYMAVVHKPAGIPVSGNAFKTVAQALPYNLQNGATADALALPLPVHRLDAATSGLLMVAKSSQAMVALGKLFQKRQIKKTYLAIVTGTPSPEGEISAPIEGKDAYTSYEVLRSVCSLRNGSLSLLKLTPNTGRTHQLRIHLAAMGHPIVGDKLYGTPGNILKDKGLFLAAVALRFRHPVVPDKELNIAIDSPNKFTSLLERETRRWKKFKESE